MDAINYSDLRANLKSVMEGVCENHEPLIVTRKNSSNLVLMSYDDYSAMEETAYLLRSPKNAKRIRESIQSFAEGKGEEKELIEVES